MIRCYMTTSKTHDSAAEDRDHPLFTIAIPTFNRSCLLEGCIAAALAQTCGDFEIVVSDNASTDDTQAMLAGFTDSRLRVFRQVSNIGLAPNWNACLAHARGDYIVFVSDDDRILPKFLERCAGLIAQEPGLPVVIGLSDIHDGSRRRTKQALVSHAYGTGILAGTDILREFFADRITVTMCSVMMRTSLFRENGGLPLDLPHMSDIAAWVRLLFVGRAGFVNEACATFTFHQRSETSRLEIEKLLSDGSRIVDLVRREAAIHLVVDAERKSVESQARSCLARRALIVLSDHRSAGGTLMQLGNVIWRCRREFVGVDMTAILRFIAKIICPEALAAYLRQRRTTPERLA